MNDDELKESTVYDNFVGKTSPLIDNSGLSEIIDVHESSHPNDYQNHWKEMPEFISDKNDEYKKLIVHFKTKEDYQEFAKVIGQTLSERTKSIYYPEKNEILKILYHDGYPINEP